MRPAALHLERGAVVNSATRDNRYRTARIIFRGALAFNAALTAFWLATFLRGSSFFYSDYRADWSTIGRILSAVFFFYVVWGFVWWVSKLRCSAISSGSQRRNVATRSRRG